MCQCFYCGQAFDAFRRGGHTKEFCSAACRATFHKAARLWAVRAVRAGLLPAEALRMALRASYTTPGAAPGLLDEGR
jgi:hypothetical protein